MLHNGLTPVCMVIRSKDQIRLSGIFKQPKQNRFQLFARTVEAILSGITEPETVLSFKGYLAYFPILWLACVHGVGSVFASNVGKDLVCCFL